MPKRTDVEDIKSPKSAVKVVFPHDAFRKLQGLNKRIVARDMFLKENKSIHEIATILKESEQQITQWGLEENWERKKLATMTSTDNAANLLEQKLLEFMIDLDNDKTLLTEHSVKIIERCSKAIASLRAEKATLSAILASLQAFVDYLKTVDPQMLLTLEPHIEAFIEKRRKQAGV